MRHGPSDQVPLFRPRFPWLGGDLQTLRNFLLRHDQDLSPWPGQRLVFDLRDGGGDRLAATLHWPAGTSGGGRNRPLVVLIHGLTGCEDSRYIRVTAAQLLRHGFAVLRLNLRGAGPSRPLCRGLYHAGRSEDLRDVVEALLESEEIPTDRGLALIGYSLGANTLLKFLSEAVEALPLLGAVSVSAPIDLRAAQRRIMAPRNRLYHRYLLDRMIADALAEPSGPNVQARDALRQVRSVYDFDNLFVAPNNGFESAEDYYERCSALRFLPGIRVPTLAVFAKDDPWVPRDAYEAFAWSRNPSLVPLSSERGGHVGFHGRGDRVPWHDRCALAFLNSLDGGAA